MSAVTSGRIILNYEFSDANLESYYSIIDNINDHLKTLEYAIQLGFM